MNLQLINKSIYDRLKTINGITVADNVMVNAKRPYIVLAETSVTPWNSKTTKGYEVTTGVLVYSDYKGDKEINEIVAKVHEVLTNKISLPLGYKVITQSLETVSVERLEEYREAQLDLNLKIFKEE
ncbi:DUF3168 domain-containing protein [uncultured Phascolarctobacterium sp.]|jgi:hypothetical protein|uniref:tail completion protein gp17 n=1 Tax=uncultured Phascolarctobacterium sp. TaxID=512296 RepID=UPI0027D983FF|nr:DUF3168 domain-containing protein [uncultured Phascolarctobacterium sp.]